MKRTLQSPAPRNQPAWRKKTLAMTSGDLTNRRRQPAPKASRLGRGEFTSPQSEVCGVRSARTDSLMNHKSATPPYFSFTAANIIHLVNPTGSRLVRRARRATAPPSWHKFQLAEPHGRNH